MDPGTLGLALGAGMLAALNPCGFALLPAYLSLFVLDGRELPRRIAALRALRATVALTMGFTVVFAVFGLVVAPVAASVQAYLPGFTVVLGAVVAGAGVWLLLGRGLPTIRLGRFVGRRRPITASWVSMTGFGMGYAVASLTCTIAPFLAVVVSAFRSGSVGSGLVLFVTYAAGMGLVVGVAAVATAMARTGLVARLRSAGRVLPKVGGLVLLLAGAYVAWYGAWELRVFFTGAGADPIVSAAAGLQQWLVAQSEVLGVVGFVLVLSLLVVLALLPRRKRRLLDAESPDEPTPSEARAPWAREELP